MKKVTKNDWMSVAKLLGLELTNVAANQALCPFCKEGKLEIFADTVFGGLRFAGHRCFRHGDLLDLIAKTQQCDRAAARQWLDKSAPTLHKMYTSNVAERQMMEEGQQLLEQVWKAGMRLKDAYFIDGFQQILRNRAMPLERHIGWHEENLFEQFRAISADDLETAFGLTKKASYREHKSKRFYCPRNMFIMSRLYSLPGQVVGLQLLTTGTNNKPMEYFEPIGDLDGEAGLLIHPDRICDGQPLVVTASSQWATKAAFVHAHQCNLLNPFASLIDYGDFKTQSMQPLFRHPVISWCSSLTPRILRAAVRLNARISHFGARQTGTIRAESLQQLLPGKVTDALGRHSMCWQEAVIEYVRQHTMNDLLTLVQKAGLDQPAVVEIAERVAPTEKNFVLDRILNPCPPRILHTSKGSVEQRPSGWVRVTRGKEQLICNKCWRIVTVAFTTDRDPYCVVELLENDKWHRCEIDLQQLTDKPFATLQAACIKLQLSIFTFEPTWNLHAMYLASQFHAYETKHTKPLGIDVSRGILRTSRVEISLEDGSLTPQGNPTNQSLLPLAGRELPSPTALAAILQQPATCRVISALVHQLISHFLGWDEITVMACGQYSALSQQVLSSCGFSDRNALPILTTRNLRDSMDIGQAKAHLLGGQATWAAGSPDVAHWLAGMRPTIYLGHKCNVGTVTNDHQTQQTVLQVIARAIVKARAGLPITDAVQHAWASLIQQVKPETTQMPIPVEQIGKVTALGRWLSKAIVTDQLTTCTRKPRAFNKSKLWFDKRSERFCVHRSAINYVLGKFSAPAWDLAELYKAVEVSSSFYGLTVFGRSDVWKFSSDILSRPAVDVLKGHETAASIREPVPIEEPDVVPTA